ncbi:MAG TPA: M48 family metalloprotease [Gammaproteobacteria bacterium]|nr:M48 family metalloprotease [Gammaproteobacteria bacterium]
MERQHHHLARLDKGRGRASTPLIAWWRPAICAFFLWAPALAAQVQLPDIGNPESSTISLAEERAIGELFMREIRARMKLIDDPEVEDYVQSLGYRLVSQSDSQHFGFTFFVVEDGSINAFAAPGGYIGINSGLVTASDSESEVASVLAHEIAHVTQRHIAQAVAAADRSSMQTLAGIVAAILIGTQSPEAGQATAAAVVGSQIQKQLNFSRANEQEADRVGMQMLHSSGFDPRAMPAFFEKLQSASRYYQRPPEFLSTHPVTTSRIADAIGRAEKFPYRQLEDSLSYQFVRAKLRVLTELDPDKAVSYFSDRMKSGSPESFAAQKYGLAIAYDRSDRSQEANRLFRELVAEFPERVSLRAALAENELRRGQLDEALRIYAEAAGLYPGNKVLVRGYANALIEAGQAKKALEAIERYGRIHALDASLYKLRANAHQKAGNPAESHMALSEHYYLNGEIGAAIHQLELASQRSGDDFYRNSRIEARLKQLESERAKQSRSN